MKEIWKFPKDSTFNFGAVEETTEVFFKLPIFYKTASFTLLSGTLPPGLIIDGDSVVGIPNEVTTNTKFVFKIRATVDGEFSDRTFSITIKVKLWTVPTGFNFGVRVERRVLDVSLPVNTSKDLSKMTFKLISGSLPPGVYINGYYLKGSPYEVPRETEFTFVIRAEYNGASSDRTFRMSISGEDIPAWITPTGLLPVGNNEALYILDNFYIDFQLNGIDADTATGQVLSYTIFEGEGELPPGLILTETGRIVGFVQPLLSIPLTVDNGNYDTSIFDKVAYDFAFRSTNGFDHWVYDSIVYDLSTPTLFPKKLNRNYEFTVTISDGDNYVKRNFRIFVVGEDHFRADSEIHQVGVGTYTADSSYVKAPIWVTPNNLGIKRSDNFHIFKLDIHEDQTNSGPVTYTLERTNPGTYRFLSTGEVVRNGRFEISGEWPAYPSTGIPATSESEWEVIEVETYSRLPDGMQFDTGTAEVLGIVPYIPAISKEYKFSVTATRLSDTSEVAYSTRTFTVTIVGDLEKSITWLTNSNLGTIAADIISNLSVKAESAISGSVMIYTLVNGRLPPGLTLNLDGEIVGRTGYINFLPGFISALFDDGLASFDEGFSLFDRETLLLTGGGITLFDSGQFSLDNHGTTIDREFTFTVRASDPANRSALDKDFTIKITTPNDRLYSNIVVKPFLKPAPRAAFKSFIADPDVFDVRYIYRLNDPNFGIQSELKMLIYAGLETRTAVEYVSKMGKNHKPKRFKLGDVKVAEARFSGSSDVVYEVVYVDVIDPLEIGQKHLPLMIEQGAGSIPVTVDQSNVFYTGNLTIDTQGYRPPIPLNASIDRNDLFVNDPETRNKFPSSVALWRTRLSEVGLSDNTYLPLWMKTPQTGSLSPLGFVKAIPLCYCKPGYGKEIVLNIKNSGFDFKMLDYLIDRYIINRIVDADDKYVTEDKYLAFKNDRTTL